MKSNISKTTRMLLTLGSLSLLSSLFIGFKGLGSSPLEVSAQTLPTNVNATNLTDAQVNSYYTGVSGLSGNDLLSALNGIIDGHREYSYDSTTDRTAYKIIDRNWIIDPLSSAQLSNFNYSTDNGYIRKFFADYNDSTLTADRFKNDGATSVSFDKEHLWAQSLGNFGRTSGAGSDFHNLVPADVKANQQMHSNYGYATPTSNITNYTSDKGTYVGRNGNISGGAEKVCEPLDQYKGDVARAMFYMPARYYTYVDVLHPKLTLVNGSPSAVTASASQAGLAGDLATLLLWNELDPVDEYEIHRNNLIYNNFQLNRNPFIDHPEWARIAYDTAYSGSGASIATGSSSVGGGVGTVYVTSVTLDASTHSMETNEQFSLTATVLPSNATNKTLIWSSSNEGVATVSNNGLVTAVSLGSATITAAANDGSGKTATCAITVAAGAKNLVSISVSGANSTTPFGSNYSTASIIVTAHYDDSSTSNVTSQANISNPNTLVLGKQAIVVSYENKTASFDVTVTNNGASEYLNNASFASDLFISEYIEGSSNNKAIEIFNGTGSAINLSSYSLFQNNAGGTTTTYTLTLSGTIQNNSTFVIANNSASATIKALANLTTTSSVMSFNGNDAISLKKGTTVIDLFGILGNSSNYAIDTTYVRKSNITSPVSTWNTEEWNTFATDNISNLGSHTMSVPPTLDDLDQANAWAEYFLMETSSQCESQEPQLESVWTTLTNEYNYMTSTAKGYYASGESSDILAAIARYNAIVDAHAENEPFISGLSSNYLISNTSNDSERKIIIISLFTVIIQIGLIALFIFNKKMKAKNIS